MGVEFQQMPFLYLLRWYTSLHSVNVGYSLIGFCILRRKNSRCLSLLSILFLFQLSLSSNNTLYIHTDQVSLWPSSLGEIEWTKVIAFAPLFVSFSFPFPCVPAWLVCLSPSAACPVPSSSGTHPEACLAPVFGHWGHLPHWCFGTELQVS